MERSAPTPLERPTRVRIRTIPTWLVIGAVLGASVLGASSAGAGDRRTATAPPTTDASAPSVTDERTGEMWPQATMEEVADAQELALAGDAAVTWQVDPVLASGGNPGEAEIVARFVRDVLGWEGHLLGGGYDHPGDGVYQNVPFVRCAPDTINPLYPDDPVAGACAPTLDEHRYETVRLDLAQLTGADPAAIWVVTRWEVIEPITQVAPVTDDELTGTLTAFLEARVRGEGAEAFLAPGPETPRLYRTSGGAAYERFEIGAAPAAGWPTGGRRATVRLFAEADETVVEQSFLVSRDHAGRVAAGLWRGLPGGVATTENGIGDQYGLLDDEVTFSAPAAWRPSPAGWHHSPTMATLTQDEAFVHVIAAPRPASRRCDARFETEDAAGFARALQQNLDLEVSDLVAGELAGGTPVVQVDVAPDPEAEGCDEGVSMMYTSDGLDLPLPPNHIAKVLVVDVFEGSVGLVAAVVTAPADRPDLLAAGSGLLMETLTVNPPPAGADPVPPGDAPIEPGRVRIPVSPWSVAEMTVSIPAGWHVQYGHLFRKYPETDDEYGFYPVVVDDIYADACGPDEPMEVGPTARDLADALERQIGPEAETVFATTFGGGFPALHVALRIPDDLDLTRCRLGEIGLQVWYSGPADKYFVLTDVGPTWLYIVDVDGRRQVFVAYIRSHTSMDDLRELEAILRSIRIVH